MAVIISLSGASASGKTTIARSVLGAIPGSRMLLSVTTRARRPSDIPGEYRYVSHEEFAELETQDAFLWSVAVHGNKYGTLTGTAHDACERDTHVAILTIPAAERLMGYLKARCPGTRFIPLYLKAAGEAQLRERLRVRGDSEEDIAIRIEECKTWDALAARSSVPFHSIDAGLPLAQMAAKTTEHIEGTLAQDSRSSTKRG